MEQYVITAVYQHTSETVKRLDWERAEKDVLGFTLPCSVRSRPPIRSILKRAASWMISASTRTW